MYKNKNILIVNANYYKKITNKMLHLQLNELIKMKAKPKVISVSGAFEIPLMISRNLKNITILSDPSIPTIYADIDR